MYLCLIITIDRERSTLLVTVNTFRACVYFAAVVGKLSYLFIVLMGHTMIVNIQFYFLSLDLIPRWLTRDIGDLSRVRLWSSRVESSREQCCPWL